MKESKNDSGFVLPSNKNDKENLEKTLMGCKKPESYTDI